MHHLYATLHTRMTCLPESRYCRLAGQLAGGDDGAAFPNADRALFQAINAGPNAAGKAKR